MDRRFWRGKRVFVTGHTGFKGGWLCAWLLDAGADVTGYALAPSHADALMSDDFMDGELRSTIADIRDHARLARSLAAARPEVIFHLAAQPLVRASYERPLETYEVNVVGTAAVLEALAASGAPASVVVVTSDKCYAAGDPARRHAESDPLGGEDPYSASKACAEIVASGCRSRLLSTGSGVATARAGNVIGGGDTARDRLLPDLLHAFEGGDPARVRRPDDVRPWQHVLDPLAGYLRLAERLGADAHRFSGAWNFGPPADHEITVGALADVACQVWNAGARWTRAPGPHPPERAVLRLDSGKALTELGWRARLPLRAAVEWTIRWYRERRSGRRVRDLMLRDIARYEAMAA